MQVKYHLTSQDWECAKNNYLTRNQVYYRLRQGYSVSEATGQTPLPKEPKAYILTFPVYTEDKIKTLANQLNCSPHQLLHDVINNFIESIENC